MEKTIENKPSCIRYGDNPNSFLKEKSLEDFLCLDKKITYKVKSTISSYRIDAN